MVSPKRNRPGSVTWRVALPAPVGAALTFHFAFDADGKPSNPLLGYCARFCDFYWNSPWLHFLVHPGGGGFAMRTLSQAEYLIAPSALSNHHFDTYQTRAARVASSMAPTGVFFLFWAL